MNIKSYETITNRIIGLLSQGTVPWHKPWSVTTGLPRNLVTQKPYRGINPFLLMAAGYESPHWLTFRQAVQLGGSVKKGEKACPVVFWKQMELTNKESGEVEKMPLLRMYFVFNVAQCEGLKNMPAEDTSAFVATEAAGIVAGMPEPPAIKHGMTKAYYSPANDSVGMPEPKRFNSEDTYHATLFHELVHSTGHEKRFQRCAVEVQRDVNVYHLFTAFCQDPIIKTIVERAKTILLASDDYFSATSSCSRVNGIELHERLARVYCEGLVSSPGHVLLVGVAYERFSEIVKEKGMEQIKRSVFKEMMKPLVRDRFNISLRNDLVVEGRYQQGWKDVALGEVGK